MEIILLIIVLLSCFLDILYVTELKKEINFLKKKCHSLKEKYIVLEKNQNTIFDSLIVLGNEIKGGKDNV